MNIAQLALQSTEGGIENLIGSGFGDTLTGDGNNNILDGGGGNDQLYGEGGSDTFVFKPGMVQDVVYDFEDGIDMIQVFDFVEADITIQASGTSDTEIVADGDSMILLDIDPSLISFADDFWFL